MFKQSMRPFAFEFNSVTLESILSEMTIKTQQHGCKQVTENEAWKASRSCKAANTTEQL